MVKIEQISQVSSDVLENFLRISPNPRGFFLAGQVPPPGYDLEDPTAQHDWVAKVNTSIQIRFFFWKKDRGWD